MAKQVRVYAHFDGRPLHDGDEAEAREVARRLSAESPAYRFDVREVPEKLTTANGATLANEGGRVERALAAYQGGKEVPVA